MAIRVKSAKSVGIDVVEDFNILYEKTVMKPIRVQLAAHRRRAAGDSETIQSIDACESYYETAEKADVLKHHLQELRLMADRNLREAQRAGLEVIKTRSIEEVKVFLLNGDGKTQREIAAELSCSPAKVNQILDRLELCGLRPARSSGGSEPGEHGPETRELDVEADL